MAANLYCCLSVIKDCIIKSGISNKMIIAAINKMRSATESFFIFTPNGFMNMMLLV
jgi:hypothetical protein